MALTHTTARWLAPAAFLLDFAAQLYGILSSPNMKDIHDAHLSFFSPEPLFVAGLFFPLQLIQIAWLYRLYRLGGSKGAAEKNEVALMLDYVPYYVLGNLCLAGMLLLETAGSWGAICGLLTFLNASLDAFLECGGAQNC